MLYAWRDFSTFHSLGFFEIGGCHLVALAERSSNLHSNLKMINHRLHNLGFRLRVRFADARRVRPGPPAEGPSPRGCFDFSFIKSSRSRGAKGCQVRGVPRGCRGLPGTTGGRGGAGGYRPESAGTPKPPPPFGTSMHTYLRQLLCDLRSQLCDLRGARCSAQPTFNVLASGAKAKRKRVMYATTHATSMMTFIP